MSDLTTGTMDDGALLRALSRSLCLALYDLEGKLLSCSPRFEALLGHASGTLVGTYHRSQVPPQQAQLPEYRAFWSGLRAGQAQAGEFLRLAEGGRELWLEASYTPVLDADGQVREIVEQAHDITAFRAERLEASGHLRALDRSLAVIEFSLDGSVLRANEVFLALMGYDAHEVVGHHHRMFMAPTEADQPAYREFWARLRAGDHQTGEFVRYGKNGKAVYITGSYAPVLDAQGKPYKVIKYASDTTFKRLDQLNQQAQLEAISRSMATIEFNLDGTIANVNEKFLLTMGYERAELIGRHHRIFCLPQTLASDDYERFWADLRAGKSQSGEFRRVAKGGRDVFLHGLYAPIHDLVGKPCKVVKYATDITNQKRTDLNYQGQLEAISRAMAIVEFNLDGTILDCNPLFEATMGYTREELLGRHHRMFCDTKYAESQEYRDLWNRIRSGEPLAMKFKRLAKGGREVFLEASYNPILDLDGKPYKCVKYATDVTQQTLENRQIESERSQMLAEGLRVKAALDRSTTCVLIANAKFEIVYVNDSMRQLVTRHEEALQRDLPHFSAQALDGGSLDVFQKNVQRARAELKAAVEPIRSRLTLGGLVLEQVVVVPRDDRGQPVGYAVEWLDQTKQVLAQQEVERVLESSIAGDLTQRLDTRAFDGFVAQVGNGMNSLLDSVADAFRHVKLAVEQIEQASQELRSTSQMMSSSSLELNRAAESSSSSLTRAAEMVKKNAEGAAMANQLVSETSLAAQGGQQRMRELGGAMTAINTSAAQIAKIIKVIDEIAFQTNLLALNAAVEAARAGRHGKGFAVVAQEVRNLAERSAKAAKETASLIEDSAAKVTHGVRMADATSAALDGIIGNVGKVVDLAAEIATASDEQARTIDSVAGAMTQVSESAQAGSQQSTEVASSAEEMGRQMEVLLERLNKYKVGAAVKDLVAPPGVSPELVEQIAAMLMAKGMLGRPALPGAQQHNDNGREPVRPAAANGGLDPRTILPLDRDERGFRGF